MSLNNLSNPSIPTLYLNPNVNSLTLSGSNVANYTPSKLDYYEEITGSLTFNDSTGAAVPNFSIAFQAQRIGNFVQFTISNSIAFTPTNVTAYIDCNNFTSAIPARFRTAINQIVMCYTSSGAGPTRRVGSVEFNVGNLRINAGYDTLGTFINVAPGNFFGGSTLSYRV